MKQSSIDCQPHYTGGRRWVIPVVYQVLLVAVGLRQTHQVGCPRGIGIGLVTVVVFFISFLAFMR